MPPKKFSYASVAEHSTTGDLYLIYRDRVFDVSKFMDEHPGGEEVLLDVGGKDATEEFEDVGHSADALQIMEGLLVGVVDKKTSKPVSKLRTTPAATESRSNIAIYGVLLVGAIISFGVYKYF